MSFCVRADALNFFTLIPRIRSYSRLHNVETCVVRSVSVVLKSCSPTVITRVVPSVSVVLKSCSPTVITRVVLSVSVVLKSCSPTVITRVVPSVSVSVVILLS